VGGVLEARMIVYEKMTIEERGRLVHKLKRRVIISIAKLDTIGFTEVHDILKYLEGKSTVVHYTPGRDFWRGENLARSTSTIGNLGGETFIGSI